MTYGPSKQKKNRSDRAGTGSSPAALRFSGERFFRRKKRSRARFSSKTMARRRRVAVLVDDSPGSMRACRYGAKHLLDKDTDVMLVTAVHDSADTPAVRTESSLGNAESARNAPSVNTSDSPTSRFSWKQTRAGRDEKRSPTDARTFFPSSRRKSSSPPRSHRSRPLRKASACASTTPFRCWVATSPPSASRR